jgi:peptidoglycan/LPS O-acetylase OafA/YrhL
MRGNAGDTNAGMEPGYQPAFDGLRGIAILLVVVFHLGSAWTAGGFLGVDLFFVLSGFLITTRLLKELTTSGTIRFNLFYARRVLRLLPALFVVLIAGTAWAVAFFPSDLRVTTTRGALSAFMYVANWVHVRDGDRALGAFGHTWSLSIEEQFYAIWPVILLPLFRLKRALHVVVALVVTLAIYRGLLALAGTDPWRLYNGSDTRCDGLFLGAAIALMLSGTVPRWTHRLAGSIALFGLTAIVLLLPFVTYHRRLTYLVVIPFANVIAAAAILASSSREPRTLVARLLSTPVLRWLGQISYSLYLWHVPVFVALQYPPLDHVNMAVGVLLATALALVSYYGIEQPMLRLKRYFRPPILSHVST